MRLSNSESEVTQRIRFSHSHCLRGLAMAGLLQAAVVLQFVEQCDIVSELAFRVFSLGQALICILLEKQLQVLLLFDELFGEQVAEPLELGIGQALVEELRSSLLHLLLAGGFAF